MRIGKTGKLMYRFSRIGVTDRLSKATTQVLAGWCRDYHGPFRILRAVSEEGRGVFALEGLDGEAGVSSEANSTSNRCLPEVDVLKVPSYSSR